MLRTINIGNLDILKTVKLYCQTPDLIAKVVARKIVEQAAEEAGIKIETEELQKAADEFRLVNKLQNSEDTWKWLESYSLSLDDFEEMIAINLLGNKLAEHLFGDQIEPYFFQNQLNFLRAAIYEIVLEDEDLSLELFYAIKQEEMSFYEAAHQYISDTELRRKCGYLGIVYHQDLKPEISSAVFSANPPQLLKPIITSQGVHLILVEEIIQPQLDQNLRQKIVADLFATWLQEQRADVEIIKQLEF